MNQPASPTACPEYVVLLALSEGTLSDEQSELVFQHVLQCGDCDARLEQIEDESDTLIRALSAVPATVEDEETFRAMQSELLAHPERFEGVRHFDGENASDVPPGIALPMQLGNYELLEQIGVGAHGAVFRARHRRLERDVAVKLLMRAAVPYIDEFLNEMRVVGRLDHPNIIRATDAGEHDGLYFLVMEFVPGLDLSSLLRRSGGLSVPDACEIARQAALGLDFAHRHDLVHRDVKTSNLLFTAGGHVKLLDLGLATIPSRKSKTASTTQSGPRGTADYMAPEQWRESDAVTASADVYSLGCTLFKLLTGNPPYRPLPPGMTSKEMAHVEGAIPSLGSVRKEAPPRLEQLLGRMLAKEAGSRPGSAAEVAETLRQFAVGSDLPGLVRKHCPELKNTLSLVEEPSATLSRSTTSRRQVLLLGLLGITACGAFLANRRRDGARSVDMKAWRTLGPSVPGLLRVQETSDAEFATKGTEVELTSTAMALLHLGSPISRPFRWQTELHRGTWGESAGLFFRFRKLPDDAGFQFHTIEISTPKARQGEAAQNMLLWAAYDTRRLDEPTILAESRSTPALAGRCTFDLVIGRNGFPEVTCDGQRISSLNWTPAREAREFVVANIEKLPRIFAGRIGVFHRGGHTHVQSSKLKYLED